MAVARVRVDGYRVGNDVANGLPGGVRTVDHPAQDTDEVVVGGLAQHDGVVPVALFGAGLGADVDFVDRGEVAQVAFVAAGEGAHEGAVLAGDLRSPQAA